MTLYLLSEYTKIFPLFSCLLYLNQVERVSKASFFSIFEKNSLEPLTHAPFDLIY